MFCLYASKLRILDPPHHLDHSRAGSSSISAKQGRVLHNFHKKSQGPMAFLRLRGGANEDPVQMSEELVVPYAYPTLHDAVAKAEQNSGGMVSNIFLRPGGSDEAYNWGQANCENEVLQINCSLHISAAAEGVQLSGPIVLDAYSQGLMHKVTWGWERQASIDVRAGFSIA